MGTPETIGNNVDAAIVRVDDLRTSIMTEVDGFLAELKDSVDMSQVPFINSGFTIFTPPTITVDAEPPIPIDVGNEIHDAFRGVNVPSSLNIGDVDTTDIESISIPDFTDTPSDVNIPEIPDAEFPPDVAEPADPSITKPNRGNYDFTLPDSPTVHDITIPEPPSFTLPEYVQDFPIDDLIVPINTFSYTEAEYTSDLLDAVNTKLLSDVQNGGTGLGEDALRAQWALQQELNDKAVRDAMDNFYAEFSGGCFDLPTGVVSAGVRKIQSDYADKRLDVARTITIKELELALNNTQWAVGQGIAVEQIMIAHHEAVAERALAVAKTTVDVGIAIFNASVTYYNAKLQAAQVRATVYEAEIRAILAQAEIYRTLIEGKKLEAAIQAQYIDIYKAQLEAVGVIQNLYKLDMEASALEADIEKMKVEIYKAKVDGYSARVAAEAAKFQALKAKIEGEMAKVQVFEAQVQAYNARMEGIKTQAGIEETIIRAQIDVKKMEVDEYRENLERWKKQADVALGQVAMLIDQYKADSSVYSTEIGKAEALANIQIKELELEVANSNHTVALDLEANRANLQGYLAATGIKTEAARGGAQITATLVGAIFNSIQALIHEYAGTTATAE